jgi:anthranilate synthase component 1
METFNYTTSSRNILADLITPVGAYLSLRNLYPQSVLMESSDYHGNDNSRSFIGIQPMAQFAVSHGVVEQTFPDGSKQQLRLDLETKCVAKEQIAHAMADFLTRFKVSGEGSGYFGLYGFTSFNAVRYFENIEVQDTTMERNDAPDIIYIMYRDLVVFDHFSNRMMLLHLNSEGEDGTAALDELEKLLQKPGMCYGFHAVGEATSTLTDEEHKANIRRCVAHCMRGDVFQIVISRRFSQRYEGDDFRLYRALRSINPSPYLFYFDFGGYRIFGSSPETHCRIVGSRAYIDPIAGTTKRTGDAVKDKKNAEFLRNDPKENAEHVMLVDLARNDLSRNCHDVKVDFYKDMQFYSHVIHLVSRVSGELFHPESVFDKIHAFFDTFPAGTLSGAPKVRAMQIISELEPHNRGAYGGCIGFIGLNSDLNQAIVIRTFISRNGELWFQAGSGVVAKSNDEYELQEANSKLGALVKAIQTTEQS